MASIRRTLSPVPRAGSSLNGEACSVSSPLSRSSSSPRNYTPSSGLLSSLVSSLNSQAFALGAFSPRISRPLEKSKAKGQIWRRAMIHFCVCFMVGIFVGLARFAPMNSSMDLMSKHRAFQFEMISAAGNFQLHDNLTADLMPVVEEGMKSMKQAEKPIPSYQISYDNLENVSVNQESKFESQKLLIVVTPSSAQPLQAYYLQRLGHTLKRVAPPLLWIVVEISAQSEETADILRRTGVMYRHIVCCKNLTGIRDIKVHQRNIALNHIETHLLDGIIYFADEDNFYSSDLFQKMRQIRRFGTWVVAKETGSDGRMQLQGPICNGSQIIGWHLNEPAMTFRRFHAEMSGFAFNSTILWDPKRWHRPSPERIRQLDTVREGLEVSNFIEQVVEDESQMEGISQDCLRVMVWRLDLRSTNGYYPQKWFLLKNLYATTSRA